MWRIYAKPQILKALLIQQRVSQLKLGKTIEVEDVEGVGEDGMVKCLDMLPAQLTFKKYVIQRLEA